MASQSDSDRDIGRSSDRTSSELTGQHEESIRLEFAVNYNGPDDLAKIEAALHRKGLKMISHDLVEKTIHVHYDIKDCMVGRANSDSFDSYDLQSLQRSLEQQTSFSFVLKGFGDLQAAVAELVPLTWQENLVDNKQQQVRPTGRSRMFGVVRLSQLINGSCFVDGSIDGHIYLGDEAPQESSWISVAVHEFGDLSSSDSLGSPVIALADRQLGDDNDMIEGRRRPTSLSFQRIVPSCSVTDMIGRSVALSLRYPESSHDASIRQVVLSAAVLARASSITKNRKKFCACSGRTLWEERCDIKDKSNESLAAPVVE